jgi:predicted PurR-regulated permease PerM
LARLFVCRIDLLQFAQNMGRPRRMGLTRCATVLNLLATGSFVQGAILIAYGFLVIGLVDDTLRPILVGKDTKLPDYVVLISTLGGIEAFGLNGFVIGPVIAAMFIAVWDIFSMFRKEDQIRIEESS